MANLAGRQHGVVSIRQLNRIGYSTRAVSRHAASGLLHRLHRGVYAVGHLNLSPHGRCLAAVLAAGEGAVASHYSAAWLWGLARTGPLPPHVTVSQPRGRHRGFELHRARNLEMADRVMVDQIPVTAVPRTLLDQAARVRFGQLRRMLERAEELRLFDLEPVEDLLARTVGHHGHGPLRRALDLYRPPRFTRSGLERAFLAAVERGGLPEPRTAWVELGYELDGIELTRVTGRRFEREPDQVMERVARLLAQRAGRSS
jgi:hypothetical protein